jgi:hypothetical protein
VIMGYEVAGVVLRRNRMHWCRDARTKIHVRASMIVVTDPLRQDVFQVALMKGDEEVQTLPELRAAEALAYGVCLWRPHRSPQHPHAHGGHALVQFPGEICCRGRE